MKPIRLVHLISSLKLGGAETMLFNLLSNLDNKLFEHHVIFFHDGPIRQKIESLKIPTYHVKGYIVRYDAFFIIKLIKLIKKINPQVINSALWTANFFGVFSARLLDIPIICTLHTIRAHEGLIRNVLDRLSLPFANQIIAVSKSVAHSFDKLPTKVIPNAIAVTELLYKTQASTITRNDLGIKETDFVIGSVGRFVKVKNYHMLLDVFASLHGKYASIKLLLIGIGPEEYALKQRAKNLGIESSTIFTVGQPAYNYYKLFDCFVQPSAYEGLSLALLEALTCSIPAIVTGKSKFHDVITDSYDGLIIELNSTLELLQAMEKLYLNKPLRKTLGQNSYDTVTNNYKFENLLNSYTELFISYAARKI